MAALTNDTVISELADGFRFLGIFLQLPSREVAQGVESGAARSDLTAILGGLSVDEGKIEMVLSGFPSESGAVSEQAVEDRLHALRRDFTYLFANPEGPVAPPYEAGFKGQGAFDTSVLAFISPTAADAERFYKGWGLAADGIRNDSPDHMGAEVDFICFLLREAAVGTNSESQARALADLEAFARTHFNRWAARFFAKVHSSAKSELYRSVGALGQLLNERLDWLIAREVAA